MYSIRFAGRDDQVAPQYPRLQQAFQRIIETTVPTMAEELQPELDQLFDKEKNPFTENQVCYSTVEVPGICYLSLCLFLFLSYFFRSLLLFGTFW